MSETAPSYIADTQFAAKLQELVNEHGIESLSEAEKSTGFQKDLYLIYVEHAEDFILGNLADLQAKHYDRQKEQAIKLASSSILPSTPLIGFVSGLHVDLANVIFEDFGDYWDNGDDDEVIPYSRWWQRAKRGDPATRMGI